MLVVRMFPGFLTVLSLLAVTVVFSGVVVADASSSSSTDSVKNTKDGVGSIRIPLTVIPMTECYPDLVTDAFPSPWYEFLVLRLVVLVFFCSVQLLISLLCSQYNGMFQFGGDSPPPVSLLIDPGSSLVAVGKDFANVSQGDVTVLPGNSSVCQDIEDEGYAPSYQAEECMFKSTYQSGQVIEGIVVQGPVSLTDAAGEDQHGTMTHDELPMVFGIIEKTTEDGQGSSLSNGIVGVDRGNISMLSQLYAADVIAEKAFGQCGTSATENGSFAVFGGYKPNASYQETTLYTGTEMSELGESLGEAFGKASLNIKDDTSGYYVVFSGLEVNGERVQNASYENLPILFDTGTPSLILSREYVQGIVSYAKKTIASGNYEYTVIEQTLPFVGEQIIVAPVSGEVDPAVVPEIFPNITFVLGQGKANITLPPEAYVGSATFEGQSGFVLRISVLGTSETLSEEDGLILGVPFIYERFVQVDASASTMTVSDPASGCIFADDSPTAPPDGGGNMPPPDGGGSMPPPASSMGTTGTNRLIILCCILLLGIIHV